MSSRMHSNSNIGQLSAQLLICGLLLVIAEILTIENFKFTSGSVATLVALVVVFIAVFEAITLGLYRITKSFSLRTQSLVFALLSMPLSMWASWELFSGGKISEVTGIGVVKVLFGIGLSVAVGVAFFTFAKIRESAGASVKLVFCVIALLGLFIGAYVDSHFQIGHYPSFHYIIFAFMLYCAFCSATLLSDLVMPTKFVIPLVAIIIVSVSMVGTWAKWNSLEAMNVAKYSNGVFPKMRQTIIKSLRSIGVVGKTKGIAKIEFADDEFNFKPTAPELAATVRNQTKNIIFILTDAYRNDYVGDPVAKTPFWDAWKNEVVRFANAYSPSDHTGRSMPSTMTSYPLNVAQFIATSGGRLRTWINYLRDAGLRTYANGNCDYVNRKYSHIKIDYCMGAEHYNAERPRGPDGDVLVQRMVDFINKEPDKPFAIYSHWVDTHIRPVSDPVAEYRKNIETIDQRFSQLISALKKLHIYDNTLIVWTSDHGYSLGEEGRVLGRHGVIERQMRIPLVMHIPGHQVQVPTQEINVSSLSIFPTILDVLAPETEVLVGAQSLLQVLLDPTHLSHKNQHAVFSSTGSDHMARRGAYKISVNDNLETVLVFDLVADPEEKFPVDDPKLQKQLEHLVEVEFQRHAGLITQLSQKTFGKSNELWQFLLRPSSDTFSTSLDQFWKLEPAKRKMVFEKIAYYRPPVKKQLRKLVRRTWFLQESWEDEDQILFIVRAMLTSRSSCKMLHARFDKLSETGLYWFASVLHHMPEKCIRKTLVNDVRAYLAKTAIDDFSRMESRQTHITIALAAGLAMKMREQTSREVKNILVKAHNGFQREKAKNKGKAFKFQTVIGSFFAKRIRKALLVSLTNDDVDLLGELIASSDKPRIVKAICEKVNSDTCNRMLKDTH